MTTANPANSQNKSLTFNRSLYVLFVLLSGYYLFGKGDISSAMTNLGLALVFDPFDPQVLWNSRPRYQRAWLIVHASLVFVLLAIMLNGVFGQ